MDIGKCCYADIKFGFVFEFDLFDYSTKINIKKPITKLPISLTARDINQLPLEEQYSYLMQNFSHQEFSFEFGTKSFGYSIRSVSNLDYLSLSRSLIELIERYKTYNNSSHYFTNEWY